MSKTPASPACALTAFKRETERQRMLDQDLWTAAGDGDVAACQRLLDQGARIDHQASNGWTPLAHACAAKKRGEPSCAFLLSRGARVDVRSTMTGEQALGVAARCGALRQAGLLIDAGADPNAQDFSGVSALLFICRCNAPALEPMARLLLERGADPALADETGLSPSRMGKHRLPEGFAPLLRAWVERQALEGLASMSPARSPSRSI